LISAMIRIRNIIIVLIPLCFFTTGIYSQVKINTITNEEIKGYVVEENSNFILLRNQENIDIKIPLKSIASTQKINSKIFTIRSNEIIGHIIKKDSNFLYFSNIRGKDTSIVLTDLLNYSIYEGIVKAYSSFGGTFGSPGGLNLLYCYQLQSGINLRFQGGYIGKMSGIQANIGLNISSNEHFEHNFSLCAGYIKTVNEKTTEGSKDDEKSYLGINYNLNWYGFFIDIGLTSSSILLYQLGYVYRFIN
jgi:hypothetical protein